MTIKEAIREIRNTTNELTISGVESAKKVVWITDTCNAVLRLMDEPPSTEEKNDPVKME